MAVTGFGNGFRMTAANDVLDAVTVGHLHPVTGRSPYKTRINAIHFVNAAATTIATLRAGGVSGVIIWSQTVTVVNATVAITFSAPQDIDDFAVTALPAGAGIIVLVA